MTRPDPLLDFDEQKPVRRHIDSRHTHICANCGSVCRPVRLTKGHFGMELILWLTFLIPGFLYSIWRLTTRYWACPHCRVPDPVPLNTPRGRKLLTSGDFSAKSVWSDTFGLGSGYSKSIIMTHMTQMPLIWQ